MPSPKQADQLLLLTILDLLSTLALALDYQVATHIYTLKTYTQATQALAHHWIPVWSSKSQSISTLLLILKPIANTARFHTLLPF